MRINCDKTELVEIINTVQKSISPKSALPILECIKIDASGDGTVIFTGNNLELCIEYKAQFDVEEGGTIALASKMFGEIVRKMPEGVMSITVNEENNVTKIKSGISEFNIQGVIAGEFPDPPLMDKKFEFSVPSENLKNIIKKTIPFVSLVEGKRPALTGALFRLNADNLCVVASDGHRLAVVNEKVMGNDSNQKIIIPGATLREVLKLLKDDETLINIVVSDRYVMFDFNEFKVFTRIIEGDFLKYESIISVKNTINLVVNTAEFRDSLERAMLLINDDASTPDKRVPVRLNIGFDKIEISCMTGKGKVNDIVKASTDGDNLTIGFNCKFLLDALTACEEALVKIEFSTAVSGCFIRSLDAENDYVFMVLPVRLN